MATIFEDKSGFVVIAELRESATKATLNLTGTGSDSGFDPHVVFVTEFAIQKGVNNNVSYALDNSIFLSVAGDRLGSLQIRGMVFGSACGNKVAANHGMRHGGFKSLLEFYNANRVVGGRGELPKVEVWYGGAGPSDAEKLTGYVAGVSSATSNFAPTALNFILDCLLVP